MYVYTPVRNNAGRATTLALARYPFSGQHPPPRSPACSSTRLPPSLPCHANPYRHLYVLPPTTHIAHLATLPSAPSSPSHPVSTASPLLPSTTRTTATQPTTHPPPVHPAAPPYTYAILLSPSVLFSFPFCFHFRLPQTPDPIHPAGTVVPYLAVSTGTPARSLKENAIIRRTSTNELIVGASRYRQYRGVLYSTSPGATRL